MSFFYLFKNADLETRLAVWNKARPLSKNERHYNHNIWRVDAHGQVIRYGDHGDPGSTYGWEIGHLLPAEEPSLQWKNELTEDPVSSVVAIAVEPTRLPIPLLSLPFLAIALLLFSWDFTECVFMFYLI